MSKKPRSGRVAREVRAREAATLLPGAYLCLYAILVRKDLEAADRMVGRKAQPRVPSTGSTDVGDSA